MATPEHRLTVILSPTAAVDLHGIWAWNAGRYGTAHADTYIQHLKDRIYDLAILHTLGKTISGRPNLRYFVIRRKAKGHGHIAVYRESAGTVEVLHIFHTAQDWQTTLIEQPPSQ